MKNITTDYKIFKRLKGNRPIEKSRVQSMKKNILENGWLDTEIFTNEKMEVIDGQTRIEALSELKMPIPFVIKEGWGIKECRALNKAGKTWSATNHIFSFAETGHDGYRKIANLMTEFSVNEYVLGEVVHYRFSTSAINDSFDFSDEDYMRAREVLLQYKLYEPELNRFNGRTVTKASCAIYMIEHGIDTEKMVEFLHSMNKDDFNCSNKEIMLKSIQDGYNHNKKKKENRIYIYETYRQEK